MNLFNRNRLDYSQLELSEMIGNIAELTKQREKSMQRAIVEKGDKQKQAELESERFDSNIKTAQLALEYMLMANVKALRPREGK